MIALIFTLRRMLRMWEQERALGLSVNRRVTVAAERVVRPVLPHAGEDLAKRIARQLTEADDVSGKRVSPTDRKKILGTELTGTCYLCGWRPGQEDRTDRGQQSNLDPTDACATAPQKRAITVEHVWPSALGGASVLENLLPACTDCQIAKRDSPSWEYPAVHDRVLPANPSDDALKSVPWSWRIARHHFSATRIAEKTNRTLKEGFLTIGPIRSPLRGNRTHPTTFFGLETY